MPLLNDMLLFSEVSSKKHVISITENELLSHQFSVSCRFFTSLFSSAPSLDIPSIASSPTLSNCNNQEDQTSEQTEKRGAERREICHFSSQPPLQCFWRSAHIQANIDTTNRPGCNVTARIITPTKRVDLFLLFLFLHLYPCCTTVPSHHALTASLSIDSGSYSVAEWCPTAVSL